MVVSRKGRDYRTFEVTNALKDKCPTKFKPGRYTSVHPVGAAKKAFSGLCNRKRIKGQCTLIITVRETTAGSNKKEFTYKLKREKLKEPLMGMRNGVEVAYLYKTRAKSMNAVKSNKRCPGVRPKSKGPMIKKSRRSKRNKGSKKREMKPNKNSNKLNVNNNKKMVVNNNKKSMYNISMYNKNNKGNNTVLFKKNNTKKNISL